jgi:large subunit ribosomal protein L31
MKTQIHPKWFDDAVVTCACGNTFTTGATMPKYEVDVCSNCHPFYTGQMKFVDTAGRVDAFMSRQGKAATKVLSKTEKRKIKKEKQIQRELARPETLAELRKEARKAK